MTVVLQASCVVSAGESILLVQEGKPQSYGKWNLPGGHVEPGEAILLGAQREVREETGFDIQPQSLIGVYSGIGQRHILHFVFHAHHSCEEPVCGPDILACKWFALHNIAAMDSQLLLNPLKLRSILRRYAEGRMYPVSILQDESGLGANVI